MRVVPHTTLTPDTDTDALGRTGCCCSLDEEVYIDEVSGIGPIKQGNDFSSGQFR